jgi:hypothetical protein
MKLLHHLPKAEHAFTVALPQRVREVVLQQTARPYGELGITLRTEIHIPRNKTLRHMRVCQGRICFADSTTIKRSGRAG